jgi:hypothetical protein
MRMRRRIEARRYRLRHHRACLTSVNLVLPDPGFHETLRDSRAYGSLLVIDEAHTMQMAYGGLTRLYGLWPDILTTGKGWLRIRWRLWPAAKLAGLRPTILTLARRDGAWHRHRRHDLCAPCRLRRARRS